MNARLFCITVSIVLAMAVTALARPGVTFSNGAAPEAPSPIGSLNCADRLGDTLNITATFDDMGGIDVYELNLVFFSGESADCLSTGDFNCPSLDLSGGEVCGCLERSSTGDITWQGTLASLGDVESVVCESSTTINFRADVIFEADDRDDEVSETISLVTDMEPPAAPESKPVVKAGEEALVVSLAESDRSNTDAASHEICVRNASASGSNSEATGETGSGSSLEDLRAGFSTCRTTESLKSDEYRFENLENDARYEVVVAAYDAAGNRSANSPIETAQPASLLDFAELYESRLNGADGETGGCSSTPSTPFGFGLLGFLVLCGLLRRVR